jgi:hypothetical protein
MKKTKYQGSLMILMGARAMTVLKIEEQRILLVTFP